MKGGIEVTSNVFFFFLILKQNMCCNPSLEQSLCKNNGKLLHMLLWTMLRP